MIVINDRDARWRAAHDEDAGHVRAYLVDDDAARDRDRRIAALVRSVFALARGRSRA